MAILRGTPAAIAARNNRLAPQSAITMGGHAGLSTNHQAVVAKLNPPAPN